MNSLPQDYYLVDPKKVAKLVGGTKPADVFGAPPKGREPEYLLRFIAPECIKTLAEGGDLKEILGSPKEVPPARWYRFENWNRAVIDLGDFAKGLEVVLEDCTAYEDDEAAKAQKSGDEIAVAAALCKGHIAEVRHDEKPDWIKDIPDDSAKAQQWRSWIGPLPAKVAARIHNGILMFRADKGAVDEGNE